MTKKKTDKTAAPPQEQGKWAKLYDEAAALKDEAAAFFRKGAAEVVDELRDESEVHIAANQFYEQVKSAARSNKRDINADPKLKAAVTGFLNDLKIVLEADSEKNYSKHPQQQWNLADQVQDITYRYQRRLEAAPGFWNQVQSFLNNLVEKVAGIKNTFGEANKSVIAKSVDYEQTKDAVTDLKTKIEAKAEEPDDEADNSFRP